MKSARSLSLGLLLAIVASPAVRAQTTIDVAKITCEQSTLTKVADPDHIAIWLSGYYNGKQNKLTVDVEKLKDYAQKVRSYWHYNSGTVMEAVEGMQAKGN
jgi:gamma-glutamylcysteine synthetase